MTWGLYGIREQGMNSNFDGLEIYNIKRIGIERFEKLSYTLKTHPNTVTKQETLFAISSNGIAFAVVEGKLLDQTQFYNKLIASLENAPSRPYKKELPIDDVKLLLGIKEEELDGNEEKGLNHSRVPSED